MSISHEEAQELHGIIGEMVETMNGIGQYDPIVGYEGELTRALEISAIIVHDTDIKLPAEDAKEQDVTIPQPTMAPFGVRIEPSGVQAVWDAFVKPGQDEPQSAEMRMLMGILRSVHHGLELREGL